MNEMIIFHFECAALNTCNCTMHQVNNCKKNKKESFELTAGILGKSSKQACSSIRRSAPVKF